MFYNQKFSNALLKFILRFIHSVTDLYSAAIRFERAFADDFDEPAPSASPGEEAIEEATEEATGESPCARGIPELPVPVVSQRHRFRPSRRHPHVRPAAQRTHSIYWSVWSWTRGEPTATGRWPASATRLPSIVDGEESQPCPEERGDENGQYPDRQHAVPYTHRRERPGAASVCRVSRC